LTYLRAHLVFYLKPLIFALLWGGEAQTATKVYLLIPTEVLKKQKEQRDQRGDIHYF
jgi:hypothetical protein